MHASFICLPLPPALLLRLPFDFYSGLCVYVRGGWDIKERKESTGAQKYGWNLSLLIQSSARFDKLWMSIYSFYGSFIHDFCFAIFLYAFRPTTNQTTVHWQLIDFDLLSAHTQTHKKILMFILFFFVCSPAPPSFVE